MCFMPKITPQDKINLFSLPVDNVPCNTVDESGSVGLYC